MSHREHFSYPITGQVVSQVLEKQRESYESTGGVDVNMDISMALMDSPNTKEMIQRYLRFLGFDKYVFTEALEI